MQEKDIKEIEAGKALENKAILAKIFYYIEFFANVFHRTYP